MYFQVATFIFIDYKYFATQSSLCISLILMIHKYYFVKVAYSVHSHIHTYMQAIM